MLKGKHIILGISGGIAAYKCATLTRLLVKAGAEVQVIIPPIPVSGTAMWTWGSGPTP